MGSSKFLLTGITSFLYDKKPYRYDIYVIDISKPDENLSVLRLTNTNGYINGYSPSNNGNWVTFGWEPTGGYKRGKGDIYLLNRESKVLQNLGKIISYID